MIKKALAKLISFENLNLEETAEAMNAIMSGDATPAQIGAFLTALRMKGETIEEIIGCAKVMREKAERVNLSKDAVDIVGTGGDCSNTFNISTCCAFVVSAAGVPVAKHGNRSVSSNCGSADVLEALGTNISLTPAQAEQCMAEVGLCFMFAPLYHKSMKHAGPVRKEMGLRTIFNILGPLSNPAFAQYQLLGVFDEKLVEPMAKALLGLGLKGALVAHSRDNLDEISVSAPTDICEVRNGIIRNYTIEPSRFGINISSQNEIKGGDAKLNAEIIIQVLNGVKGAKRDIVLINSGAALYISGKAKSIKEGIDMAVKAIDSGAALKKLEDYKKLTQSFVEA